MIVSTVHVEPGISHERERAYTYRQQSPYWGYLRPSRPLTAGQRVYRVVTTHERDDDPPMTHSVAFRSRDHAMAWFEDVKCGDYERDRP